VRRLIINADDLGITPGVNGAIVEAHQHGVVTSASLMANGKYFGEAAQLVRSVPKLSVGCHVVLVDGSPLSPADRVPSLLTATNDGRFPASFGAITRRTLLRYPSPEELETEIVAQIQKLQAAGIRVSHLDSHKHVHMLPILARSMIRAAVECGVPAIRNPFVPRRPLPISIVARRRDLWLRYAETKLLRGLHQEFRRIVAKAGISTTDGSFGVVSTGSLDADLFRTIASIIPEGTWEFVCHPGYNDDQLRSIRTRLRESREIELGILTSADARNALAKHGIELISFRELGANI
jgi:predicted glycoside hydrolase/deacetylase ChbG (UPF0249 family)